MTSLLKKM